MDNVETKYMCAYITFIHAISFLNGYKSNKKNWEIDIEAMKELGEQLQLTKSPYIEDVVNNIVNFNIIKIPEYNPSDQKLNFGQQQIYGLDNLINYIRNNYFKYLVRKKIVYVITWPGATQSLLINNMVNKFYWRDSHIKKQYDFTDLSKFFDFLKTRTNAYIMPQYDVRILLGDLKEIKIIHNEYSILSKEIKKNKFLKRVTDIALKCVNEKMTDVENIDVYIKSRKVNGDNIDKIKKFLFYRLYC